MESIIQKAIDGGYENKIHDIELMHHARFSNIKHLGKCEKTVVVCDPLFWQALGKACEWESDIHFVKDKSEGMSDIMAICGEWRDRALEFHRINLMESWDEAVNWLQSVVEETHTIDMVK